MLFHVTMGNSSQKTQKYASNFPCSVKFYWISLKFCPRWKIQFCQLISKTAYKMLKTVIPRILVTLDCLILFWYDSKGLVLNGYSHINMYIISDIRVCSIITEFDLMGCDSWFTPRFWISTSLEQPRLM